MSINQIINKKILLKQSYKNKEVGVDYSDIEDLSDFIDNLKSQEKYYVAAIASATADLASKTVAIATQTATAAASSGTLGFSAGVSLDLDGSKTNTQNKTTSSNASNLVANNITINTKEDTNIIGSNVVANESLNINTNNLNIKASQDTTQTTQDSESLNGSVSFTMYGGGGGTASLGGAKQSFQSNSEINNNSQLLANNMYVNVKNDANFIGASLRAEDTLNLNVGNNLTLESLRDESSSNSKGFNANVGVGSNTTNAGFSMNNGVSQSKQTVLSSITGDNVNINVDGNTHLKGSVIASDSDNLDFTTNTLTFANLSNSSYSSSKSLGASVSSNVNGDVSSVGYNSSNSLEAEASKTLATLGTGNVTIKDKENSDDITKLKQDVNSINKDLYSSKTGTKVDATLDTRLLTEDGRKEIKEDIKVASKITDTIEKIITLDDVGIKDFFGQTEQSVKQYQAYKELLSNNPELVEKLQDPNLTPQEKQIYANQMLNALEKSLGYSLVDEVKVIYTDEIGANDTLVKGYISLENNTIYSNDKYQETTEDTIFTLGQEFAGAIQNNKGIDITQNREIHNQYQNAIGQDTVDDIKFVMNNFYNSSLANTNNHNLGIVTEYPSVFNTSVNMLNSNNQEYAGLDKSKGDDRVTVYSRPVIDTLGITANHLFIVVDEREDGKPDTIISLGANGNMLKGGTPIVEVKEIKNITANIDSDNTLEKDYGHFKNNIYNNSQEIVLPKGMTQIEFDELVIKNANLYDTSKNQYPSIRKTIDATIDTVFNGSLNNPSSDQRNSNTFVDNVIEQSDGNIKDFKNAPLQNSGESYEKLDIDKAKKNNSNLSSDEIRKMIRQQQGFADD